MGKREVDFKAVMELDRVVAFLEDLRACLKQGVLCIQNDTEYVVLNPSSPVKVEIEAKEKKDKSKFGLELSWKSDLEIKGDASGLKISSLVPQLQSEPEEDEKEPTRESESVLEDQAEDCGEETEQYQ